MRWTQAEYDAWDAKVRPAREKTDRQEADPGPESVLQNKIKKWANDNGYVCQCFRQSRKARGFLVPGLPDCIIALPKGVTLWLELKGASGVLSKEQKMISLQLLTCGQKWYKIKSFKRFMEVIHENTV